ncbi:MAG: hypothetical protein NTX63_00220 [Candidatus Peregrinibacteria bacterium]|nr:hypothetical protein [Candidatus Peregrinibacteria bacterium]
MNISNTSDATGTQTVSIGSAAKGANVLTLEGGTAAAAIQIGNGVTAHGIQIGSDATAANAVKLGGANASSVTTIEGGTAAGAILIGNGATAHGIQIGAGNATQTIKIGDHASASNVITIGGALSTTTITGKTILAGSETIVAGGTSTALSLFKTMHYIDADAGGDIFTLADGAQGQITTILMASSTGTATITPANLAGGTSVTFNAAGDTVVLQFNGTKWWILGGNSYAVI